MSNHRFSRRDWLKRTSAGGMLLASGPFGIALINADDKAGVLDIGSRRELFVDGLLVEKSVGLRLKLHEPRPAGVAVKYDGPADERFCFYTTVLKDGDTYRMYYRGHPGSDWTKSVTCYAESRDGKPYDKGGNIAGNPGFASQEGKDYRLSEASPCIDTGTDVLVPEALLKTLPKDLLDVISKDLLGNARPQPRRACLPAKYEMGA